VSPKRLHILENREEKSITRKQLRASGNVGYHKVIQNWSARKKREKKKHEKN
jgi:hypothetical protein